jgi:hypothetical protein
VLSDLCYLWYIWLNPEKAHACFLRTQASRVRKSSDGLVAAFFVAQTGPGILNEGKS